MQEEQVQSLSQENPLEEEMATLSSIPSLEIPWTKAVLRWQRNRMGRPLSPPQIHGKIIWTMSSQDQLVKQGFQKHDTIREWETRHKNSEKTEDQRTSTAPRWRCRNWIQASFVILSAVKERLCRKLNYISCGLQDQRTKWSLTIE